MFGIRSEAIYGKTLHLIIESNIEKNPLIDYLNKLGNQLDLITLGDSIGNVPMVASEFSPRMSVTHGVVFKQEKNVDPNKPGETVGLIKFHQLHEIYQVKQCDLSKVLEKSFYDRFPKLVPGRIKTHFFISLVGTLTQWSQLASILISTKADFEVFDRSPEFFSTYIRY